MPPERPRFDALGFLSLAEVRRFIRTSPFRRAVGLFALLYVLGAAFSGGMVVFAHFSGGYTSEVILADPTSPQWWNYPGLLVVAPWGALNFPFLATVAMIAVGVGVGLGMTVALILTVRLVRPSTEERVRSKAVGAVTGLTPAMISLVTLGACCTTTAVATAGIGLVADVSATSVSNLLLNNWYLSVFQVVIVWVSLLAQELLLSVYGGLFGRPGAPVSSSTSHPPIAAWLGASALRTALFLAGLLWTLEVAAEWTVHPAGSAGVGLWASWVLQHGVVGLWAVAFGLFPAGSLSLLRGRGGLPAGVRALLLGSGLSLLLWFPPTIVAAGFHGLPNELLGAAPASWGAVSVSGSAAVLAFRWGVEYLLLGAAAIAFAIRPRSLGERISRGVPRRRWEAPLAAAEAASCPVPAPRGPDAAAALGSDVDRS